MMLADSMKSADRSPLWELRIRNPEGNPHREVTPKLTPDPTLSARHASLAEYSTVDLRQPRTGN
jgi:hypothetical protein